MQEIKRERYIEQLVARRENGSLCTADCRSF